MKKFLMKTISFVAMLVFVASIGTASVYAAPNLLLLPAVVAGPEDMTIASVALAEVGLPDSVESPVGSNNVKYNSWYYGEDVSGDSYPWSAVFVSWCAEQCGLIDDGTFLKTAGCYQAHTYLVDSMGFAEFDLANAKPFGGEEAIVPGDILFWYDGGDAYTSMGIITSADGSTVECVSGNYGDQVALIKLTKSSLNDDQNLLNAVVVHPDRQNTENEIYAFLTETMDLPTAAACGILANIEHESHCNPNAASYDGRAYGLCQWSAKRLSGLAEYCSAYGLSPTTLDGQLRYLQYELETNYSSLVDVMKTVPDDAGGAETAAKAWCNYFERPANVSLAAERRGEMAAETYWPMYGAVEV